MLGPTLMAFGTEEQQRELVPRLLSGEDAWCQLFSEPGAGSDLASLGCRAVRDGDDFVVTGQKVWNSAAQWCDRGMLLVRTNPDVPKHHGITFLLVDMRSPGIEVRPLVQATGAAHFNEVFLEDVRIPVANVLGEIDGGWARGAHRDGERVGDDRRFGGSSAFAKLLLLAQQFGRTDDPVVRQRLADSYMRERALGLLADRIMAAIRRRERPPVDPSILKLFIAVNQRHRRQPRRGDRRTRRAAPATTRSAAGSGPSSWAATASRSVAAPTRCSATTSPSARSDSPRSPAPIARCLERDPAGLNVCRAGSAEPAGKGLRNGTLTLQIATNWNRSVTDPKGRT